MCRIGALILVGLAAGRLAAGEVPKAPGGSPGMEQGEWQAEAWGNPGAVEKVDSQGTKLLKLEFKTGEKEYTAFKHATAIGLPKDGKLKLHVYAEQPVPLSLALTTKPACLWSETKVVELKKGWNKLEFSVDSKDWKTAASDWKYTANVEAPNDVRGVFLMVQNQQRAGEIFVYNFEYSLDERGKEVQKLLKDLGDKDAQKRAEAEKKITELGAPATEQLSQLAEVPEFHERAAALLKAMAPPAVPAPAAEAPKTEGPGAGARPALPRPVVVELQKKISDVEARLEKLEQKCSLLLQRLDKLAPPPPEPPAPEKAVPPKPAP